MSTTKQGNPATSSPETIGRTRDDRVFRETRWLSAIIIPFLLAAFYILYLRSGETKAARPDAGARLAAMTRRPRQA